MFSLNELIQGLYHYSIFIDVAIVVFFLYCDQSSNYESNYKVKASKKKLWTKFKGFGKNCWSEERKDKRRKRENRAKRK